MLGDCILAMARIAGGAEENEESERDMRAGAFVIAELALLHRASLMGEGSKGRRRR